jgi:sigma-B regulation protein RsbU (phosphoserine phosphatase)
MSANRSLNLSRPEIASVTLFSLSRLFVTLLVISFLAETGVMFLLPVALPRASRTVEAFADAVLLTVIIAPVIGWLVIRPLQGAALREKAHAAAVIAHALDGILTLDQLGIVASCNPAAEAMFGYSSAELMGKSIESLISRPGRDESSHQSLIEQLICNFHGQRAGLEFQGRRKDGTELPIELSGSVVRLDGQETLIAIARDVTERKRAEVQLASLNARMKRDLDAAAQVQRELLPHDLPQSKFARFAWVYRPCDELGGDSINVFQLDPQHIGLFVLDVSGHGVRSALLSVSLTHALTPRVDRSSIVTRPDAGERFLVSPAEVAGQLNRMFPMRADAAQFATMIYGILDTEHRQFRYTNVGHPAPVLVRPGEPPLVDESSGPPIGIFEDAVYAERTIRLQPGDRLVFYSDGLIEAHSPENELFGTQRLLDLLLAGQSETLDEVVRSLEQHVVSWTGNKSLQDDLSILAVEIL